VSLRSQAARRPRLKTWLLAGAVVFAAAVAVSACGFADSFRLEVAQYTCESPELPAAFDGTRVVLLTDIHCGRFYSEERVRRLVDRVNELRPDLILLGGDYVYDGTKYEASCFAEFARLDAPLGCFAVLGNHDYGDRDSDSPGPDSAIEAATEAGITLLRNQAVWIEKDGQRVRVGGVADYWEDRPRLAPIVAGTKTSDFVLLVSHNPDYSEDLPAGAVDLVLSGHTHGGQVTLFGSWGFLVPSIYGQKYRTGVVKNEATTVVISNGIGTSTIVPIRLFAPAQIVVITLRSGPSASVHP
jgi:predicted MPP superfamily phosphohydrolase